ncbi:unnamed protein product, partial [Pleuronectes platessa]
MRSLRTRERQYSIFLTWTLSTKAEQRKETDERCEQQVWIKDGPSKRGHQQSRALTVDPSRRALDSLAECRGNIDLAREVRSTLQQISAVQESVPGFQAVVLSPLEELDWYPMASRPPRTLRKEPWTSPHQKDS